MGMKGRDQSNQEHLCETMDRVTGAGGVVGTFQEYVV